MKKAYYYATYRPLCILIQAYTVQIGLAVHTVYSNTDCRVLAPLSVSVQQEVRLLLTSDWVVR